MDASDGALQSPCNDSASVSVWPPAVLHKDKDGDFEVRRPRVVRLQHAAAVTAVDQCGQIVWPSAAMLAAYCLTTDAVHGTVVLELGGGVGLTAAILASHAAGYTLTGTPILGLFQFAMIATPRRWTWLVEMRQMPGRCCTVLSTANRHRLLRVARAGGRA